MQKPRIDTATALDCVRRWSDKSLNPSDFNAIQLLEARTGEPEKRCYATLHKLDDKGLIEYGISIRVPWLTDAGKAYLETHEPLQYFGPGGEIERREHTHNPNKR